MAFCTECGANVPEDLKFCTECGKPMGASPAQQQSPPQQQTKPPIQTAQPNPAPVYTQPGLNAGANAKPPKGSKYAVMGTLSYIGTFILFAIPIVGLIFCIVWAFGKNGNLNRRNLARAYLIFTVIAVVLAIIGVIFISSWLNSLLDYLRNLTDGQFGNWKDITDGLNSLPTQ